MLAKRNWVKMKGNGVNLVGVLAKGYKMKGQGVQIGLKADGARIKEGLNKNEADASLMSKHPIHVTHPNPQD